MVLKHIIARLWMSSCTYKHFAINGALFVVGVISIVYLNQVGEVSIFGDRHLMFNSQDRFHSRAPWWIPHFILGVSPSDGLRYMSVGWVLSRWNIFVDLVASPLWWHGSIGYGWDLNRLPNFYNRVRRSKNQSTYCRTWGRFDGRGLEGGTEA